MCNLAGIYWFDRRPVELPDALSFLQLNRLQDSSGLWMAFDPSSAVAQTPDLCCCLDGRIDHTTSAAGSDSALDLYRHSGAPGLGSLIGDWSLVLWDERRRTLLLASDYAGTRPLYYFHSADCVAWSSSLDLLAQWMGCRRLDRDYVADFLATGYPKDRTPYVGIRPVPPGSAISISPHKIEVTEIWSYPPAGSVTYSDEIEYEEHFRSLFAEAVGVRLRDRTGVAAELSGGLDSTSIVCMADHLIRSGAVSPERLVTFSYFVPGSPDHRFIALAEKACPTVTPVHLEAGRYPMLTPATPGNALPIWAEARFIELRRRFEEMGLSVLLTGQLGDLITGNLLQDFGQAADYFWRGQFRAGGREALAWVRALNIPAYGVLWKAIWSAAGWRAGEFRSTAPSQRTRLAGLSQLRLSRFFQCPEPLTGTLYSHPFTHRPLVEFLLAIPPAIVCRPGEPRRLLRRALRGIVPEAILRRRSKGNYQGWFLDSLRPCAADLLQAVPGLWLARLGCVNRRAAARGLRQVSDGLPSSNETQQVIRLEHWLRHNIRRGAIAVSDSGVPEIGIA